METKQIENKTIEKYKQILEIEKRELIALEETIREKQEEIDFITKALQYE